MLGRQQSLHDEGQFRWLPVMDSNWAELHASGKLLWPTVGKPEADKVTFPLNPFRELTVIVLMPLALCVTIKLLGDAERL